MIGQVVGHYRVLDRIGAGGMGTVYRAEDQRLGRQVALKFLPADLARVPGALERFRREAEAVSSLNHPHVCTLYDVGDDDGRQFLVLELVEGRVLKDVLQAGPLPADRAIAVATELADALDAAHSRSIVHRDIKPANIMVTSRGAAKLMDFGIATLTSSASAANQAPTAAQITMPGSWIGTPGYMAPEQARGEPADTRSDLFALGAVLYEMVTGRAPFGAASPTMAIDAVLNRTPPAPSSLDPTIPEDLSRVVAKALEKDPGYRYQTARELLTDLRRLARDTGSTRVAASSPVPVRTRGFVTFATLAVILGVVAAWWYWSTGRPAPVSAPDPASGAAGQARLVVLPFENLTRRADDDWLAGAFADSVSAGLQPVESLILVPRERVVELYDGEGRHESAALGTELARQISQKLRVRYYVHGSYQRVGDDVRVVARLVDATGDAIRAQETLTGRFTDILTLQDTLAGRLAARLSVNGGIGAAARPASAPNLRTLQLVTDARAAYAVSRYDEASALLRTATAADPQYGPAWALLAKVNSRLLSPVAAAGQPSTQQYQDVLEQARTAASLSPGTVESSIAMALAYRGLLDRPRMQEMAQRAVDIDPRSGEARILLGDALSISPGFGCPTSPQPDAAERAYLEALRIDPLFASGYLNLVTLRWWLGRRAEALVALEEGLAVQPQNAILNASRPFNTLFAGRVDEAERLLRQRLDAGAPLTRLEDVTLGYAALKRQRWAEADARFANAETARSLMNRAYTMITAVAYFEAGRPAEGASYLSRGVAMEPDCAAWARIVPALAPYRDLPEFVAALTSRR
jgi:TolB-like protein/Tfp pilus assembly protein PilF